MIWLLPETLPPMSPAILPQVTSLDDPIPSSRTSSYTVTINDSRSEAFCGKDADANYDPYLIDSFEPGDPDNPQVNFMEFLPASSLLNVEALLELVGCAEMVSNPAQWRLGSQRVSLLPHAKRRMHCNHPYLSGLSRVRPVCLSSYPGERAFIKILTASGVFHQLREEFHLSEKLGTLTLSLFVCGYCVG